MVKFVGHIWLIRGQNGLSEAKKGLQEAKNSSKRLKVYLILKNNDKITYKFLYSQIFQWEKHGQIFGGHFWHLR